MPVRSLRSPVLRWPDRSTVLAAVEEWARRESAGQPDLLRLGVFGSYARGDCGVGSDLDLVAVVAGSDLPFERRSAGWDLLSLPVPADLLVYTRKEWEALLGSAGRFARVLRDETLWVLPA